MNNAPERGRESPSHLEPHKPGFEAMGREELLN
jgi:hypothetical protein